MAIIKDTVRPELQRIKTELSALGKLTIHVGIQGTAGSDILTIAGVHEYGATIRAKNVKFQSTSPVWRTTFTPESL